MDDNSLRFLHHLEVHQIELERQNAALLHLKEQAEVESKKYLELYDSSPSGYFTLSREGEILELNLAAAEMLGKNRSNLKNSKFGFFVSNATKPIFNLFIKNAFNSFAKETCEVKLSLNGDKHFDVSLSGIVKADGAQCFVTAVNITDRLRAFELQLANKELLYQNEEKEKRREELSVAIANSLKLTQELELHQIELKMQNNEIKKKSAILDNVIINLHEGILLEDANRKIVLTNQLFCDMFAIPAPPEALTGADCSESAEQNKQLFINPKNFVAGIDLILDNKKAVYNDKLELLDGRHFERDYIPTWYNEVYSGHLWKYRDVTEQKQAQQKLQASEERYHSIFEGSPDGILIVDAETKMIAFANAALCRSFGYTEEQFKKMTIADIHPQDTFSHTLAEFESIVSGEKALAENIQCLNMNGEIFYADISGAHISINGKTLLLGFFRDISARKIVEEEIHDLNANLEHRIAVRTVQLAESNAKLEQENEERLKISTALRESLDRLNKIADRVPGVVYQYRLNPDGSSCFPFASEGIRDIYRVSPEEVALDATAVFARIHPDDFDGVATSIQASAKDQTLWKHEYRVKFDDGTELWLSGNAMPQHVADGSVLWHGFITDITDQKLIEKDLELVSSRLSLATSASGVGVWDYDLVNNILIWDDQMFALYGIKKEDFSGAYSAWQSGLHPEDKEQGDVEIQMAILGEKEFDTEFRVVWPDGSIHNIRAIAIVQHDSSGKPLNMIGTNWDITEQIQKEEALKQARSEADRANLAKSEFLSRMSHELRTPMNSILGFAQLMGMGELTASHKKWISHIQNSGKHLLGLINEVLELAGIESGKKILVQEPLRISDIIHEMLDMVQFLANQRNVTIELVDSPAYSLFVFADKLRLNQVLLNLTSNAVKYNREGGLVTINAALQPKNTYRNALVRISISDTGNGIKPEDITKLFQPFERIGADKTKIEGTGLGLVVVKELIEMMGGAVGVESEIDKGSTFWVELPVTEERKSYKESGFQSENELLTHSPDHEKSGTILYIEDNASNAELVEQILLNNRATIRLVSNTNGTKAVSLAIEYAPDLILLDLDLPDIQGLEVIKLLQTEEKTRSIPVVVVSADATPRQIEKLMKEGSKDYLIKPLDIIAFLDVVDKWVGE